MNKILVANISKEICALLPYTTSYLNEEDMDKQMKDLVLEVNEEKEISFREPFLYLFDLHEDEINEISDIMKKHQIHPITVVSTTHNLQWTFQDLITEVMQEHVTFQTMNQLQDVIKKTLRLPRDENQKEVEKALMASFIVLQNHQLDEMKKMIKILEEFHKK